jgi:threonyl-tRNA synthetase
MIKSAVLSGKSLPLRVYEISNSFRLEKSGECSGLKRLRAFTMPDIHCFCGDLESGLEEYSRLHHFYDALMHETGLPFALGFRTVEEFWNKGGKEYIQTRLNDSKKEGLVEILKEMKHYWNLKNEFQYIDSSGDNVQLSTVQLDISDSERYGLMYTGSDGQKKPMVIVHSSMGSIERIMGAILEERAKEIQNQKKPCFPYWLAPTQLRLIPINENHLNYCQELAGKFERVRVDVDDRTETGLNKRVRSAEKEWVPVYAVVGDKEVESGNYSPKSRSLDVPFEAGASVSFGRLQDMLGFSQGKRPYRNSYLPQMVSRQLRFGSSY